MSSAKWQQFFYLGLDVNSLTLEQSGDYTHEASLQNVDEYVTRLQKKSFYNHSITKHSKTMDML